VTKVVARFFRAYWQKFSLSGTGRFSRGFTLTIMISFSWRESKFHERTH
jgi:hypothetical protein